MNAPIGPEPERGVCRAADSALTRIERVAQAIAQDRGTHHDCHQHHAGPGHQPWIAEEVGKK